jgi:hypothetical protein
MNIRRSRKEQQETAGRNSRRSRKEQQEKQRGTAGEAERNSGRSREKQQESRGEQLGIFAIETIFQ